MMERQRCGSAPGDGGELAKACGLRALFILFNLARGTGTGLSVRPSLGYESIEAWVRILIG